MYDHKILHQMNDLKLQMVQLHLDWYLCQKNKPTKHVEQQKAKQKKGTCEMQNEKKKQNRKKGRKRY